MMSELATANAVRSQAARAPAARAGWLRHIGLLNDYVRIPYANGSSFATQFLYREFRARDHDVTVVGPGDPDAQVAELPERYVCLRSLPVRSHPGLRLPFPSTRELARVAAQRFDLVLGQTGSELAELGVWLRATQHVPFVAVNTLHLRTVYNSVLPELLADRRLVTELFDAHVVPSFERHAVQLYNRSDGLVVLCRGLARYWRERGVHAPIHVVPRSVDPKVFGGSAGADPFDPRATRGQRLLVVCRHTREKSVDRVLSTFAAGIAPRAPRATLTLVGDGPEHEPLAALARRLGVADRVFFPGEFPVTEVARFYRHADLFLYASQSETYGQVVSEALWCGLPVVAFADEMGVSDQIEHGRTGALIAPGPDPEAADHRLAATTLRLLRDAGERRSLAEQARERTRARTHPDGVVAGYYEVFERAREHCLRTTEARIADRLSPSLSLARWTALQCAAVGIGSLRRPPRLNRHGRKQPGWHALER